MTGCFVIGFCSFNWRCFCEPVVTPVDIWAAIGVFCCEWERIIWLPCRLDCLLLICLWMALMDLLFAFALPEKTTLVAPLAVVDP